MLQFLLMEPQPSIETPSELEDSIDAKSLEEQSEKTGLHMSVKDPIDIVICFVQWGCVTAQMSAKDSIFFTTLL